MIPMLTADTITDEQIKAMWRESPNSITGRELMDALGIELGPCYRKPTSDEICTARARCAEILNGRCGFCSHEPMDPMCSHNR